MQSKSLIIATDGALKTSTSVGGFGIVWTCDEKIIGKYSKKVPAPTTNNRCELLGIIFALSAIKRNYSSITIYSDSMYCIGTLTKNWKRKKNKDLWDKVDIEIERVSKLCPEILFCWCKGHTKETDFISKLNNIVDNLANNASNQL